MFAVAPDDRERLAPISLPRKEPVAQLVINRAPAEAPLFQRGDDRLLRGGGRQPVDERRVGGKAFASKRGGRVFNPAAAYKAALLALLARDLLSDPAARLLDAKDRLAFLHQIEPITRDGLEIDRIGLEQIHLSRLPREQYFLFADLALKPFDLSPALLQLLILRQKKADDDEERREHK